MNSWQQYIDIVSFSCIRIIASIMIFFGVALLTTSTLSYSFWSNQIAQTIGADGTIINTTDTTTANTTNTNSSTDTETTPTDTQNTNTTSGVSGGTGTSNPSLNEVLVESAIRFVSDVPDKTRTNFEVVIEHTGVTYLKVSVNGLNINKTLLLRASSEATGRVAYTVAVNDLPVGKYELRAIALRLDGTQLKVTGDKFEVIPKETETVIQEDKTNEIVASTSNVIIPITEEETEDVVITPVLPTIKVTLPIQATYRNFVPVQILTSVKVPSVAVYIQSPKLTQAQFVGSAKYFETGQWLLMVDTSQIPNGEYKLYAVANLSDVSVESEKKLFVIYNPPLVTEPIKATGTVEILPRTETPKVPFELESREPIREIAVNEVKAVENKSLSLNTPKEVVESIQPASKVILNEELKSLVPRLLREYQKEINIRLKIYSENIKVTKEIVPKEAQATEKEIMELLLSNERLQEISPEAKLRLEKEVARMVKNARQVELLLLSKEANKQNGEEFIKEFTKNIDIPEDSLVDVSSPKEFGLVRDDLMKIESVAPIVAVDTVSTTTTVHTEIRGKALPNSLVTLYIYSSPVMVTVRTDADGTFVYVYEKDLSQGDHEVYVALTTDTGAVAVKSEGFQFVREAEAFSPPISEEGDILEPVTDNKPLSSNPYFIALSFSVLFFGFALMFIGLRAEKKPVINTIVSE